MRIALALALLPFALSAQKPKDDQLDIPRSSVPLLPAARYWNQPFEPLTVRQKFKLQLLNAVGPWALVRSAAFAGLDHSQNDPFEWGQGWGPYGRRWASRAGTTAIRRMVQFGVNAVRHEDPRFFRSGETGVWPRIRNQLKQTVIVRTDDGGQTIAAGRLTGAFSGSLAAKFWQPESRDGLMESFARGGMVVATDIPIRVLREFWPEISSLLKRGKKQTARDLRPSTSDVTKDSTSAGWVP